MRKSISEEKYEFIEDEGIPDFSRIGFTDDGFEIFVGTDDPGEIPHFHYRNADRSVNTGIQILKAEYFFLGEFRGTLDEIQRENLQKFLLTSCEECSSLRYNNWEYIIVQWNMNNSRDVWINLKDVAQPDYTLIKESFENYSREE